MTTDRPGSGAPAGRTRLLPAAVAVRALLVAALTLVAVACAGPGGSGGADTGRADTGGSSVSGSPAAKSVTTVGRSVPVSLHVRAIGVDTPLIRLGLAKDGSVQVPPIAAHDRAGWYEHSPTPGQKGPSVILGHVTVGSYGDGVFRHLADLRKGDEIVARLQDGTSTVFAVTEVRTVAKADFPTKEVYGDVDRPELRLITCGGARTGDGYLDNVIVFAVLRSASP